MFWKRELVETAGPLFDRSRATAASRTTIATAPRGPLSRAILEAAHRVRVDRARFRACRVEDQAANSFDASKSLIVSPSSHDSLPQVKHCSRARLTFQFVMLIRSLSSRSPLCSPTMPHPAHRLFRGITSDPPKWLRSFRANGLTGIDTCGIRRVGEPPAWAAQFYTQAPSIFSTDHERGTRSEFLHPSSRT